jgi:hypothetical protein
MEAADGSQSECGREREVAMDVPTCRVCGVAVVEVLDWGRDLYDGLCGGCGYRKEVLRARGDTCEWCSEPETPDGPLAGWLDPDGNSVSWVCPRCYRGASARGE